MPTIRDLLELTSTPTALDMLPIDTPTGTRKVSSALLRGPVRPCKPWARACQPP